MLHDATWHRRCARPTAATAPAQRTSISDLFLLYFASIFPLLCNTVSQVCQAYRCDGGTTVVVLAKRPKLEMEAAFRCVGDALSHMLTRMSYRQCHVGALQFMD